MTNNDHMDALTGAYVVDALDDLERARFERHLAECPTCAHEVRSLREAAALLPTTVETTLPASLRENVLDQIKTVRPLPPEVPVEAEPGRTRRSRRFPARLAAVAAAVVMLVGGGVVLQQQQQDTTVPVAQQVLEAGDAHSQTLSFPDGSKATLTHSSSVDRAVLQTVDMASPPQGKVYELWLQKDGRMVPAGLMPDKADQTVLLEGNVEGAEGVGITVEPASGSDAPTSDPIALFDLKADA